MHLYMVYADYLEFARLTHKLCVIYTFQSNTRLYNTLKVRSHTFTLTVTNTSLTKTRLSAKHVLIFIRLNLNLLTLY